MCFLIRCRFVVLKSDVVRVRPKVICTSGQLLQVLPGVQIPGKRRWPNGRQEWNGDVFNSKLDHVLAKHFRGQNMNHKHDVSHQRCLPIKDVLCMLMQFQWLGTPHVHPLLGCAHHSSDVAARSLIVGLLQKIRYLLPLVNHRFSCRNGNYPGKYTHKYPLNSFKSWSDPCQHTQLNLHFFLNPHFDELNPSKSKSISDPMFDLLDPLVKSHGSGPPRLNSFVVQGEAFPALVAPNGASTGDGTIRTHQNPSKIHSKNIENPWNIINPTIKHHQTSSNIIKHHQESSDFSQFSPDFSIHFPPPPRPPVSPGCRRGTEAFPVALHHGVDAPQLLHGGRSIVAGPWGVMGFKLWYNEQ